VLYTFKCIVTVLYIDLPNLTYIVFKYIKYYKNVYYSCGNDIVIELEYNAREQILNSLKI